MPQDENGTKKWSGWVWLALMVSSTSLMIFASLWVSSQFAMGFSSNYQAHTRGRSATPEETHSASSMATDWSLRSTVYFSVPMALILLLAATVSCSPIIRLAWTSTLGILIATVGVWAVGADIYFRWVIVAGVATALSLCLGDFIARKRSLRCLPSFLTLTVTWTILTVFVFGTDLVGSSNLPIATIVSVPVFLSLTPTWLAWTLGPVPGWRYGS